MQNHASDPRCWICHRATLKSSNLSLDSETLASNASLLREFLNCFHINVLDSQLNDLSTSCHFCPTCEQFLAEWSRIQSQMTQLTRRAAHLKATLAALLLSAPEIHEPNPDVDVTEIINKRIQNSSQHVELPLPLQQTVDDIRNELRKKYSVHVILDKIHPPPEVQKLDPLALDYDNVKEAWDHLEGTDDCDEECFQSEDPLNDEQQPSEQFFEKRIETEEVEANSDDFNSQASVDSKHTRVKDASSKTNSSDPKRRRRRYTSKTIIPVGPKRFKYAGMSFQRNEEDQTYTCDTCGFRSAPKILSIWLHLRHHLTKKDFTGKREKPPAVVPDGPNRFKYNGYGVSFNDQDQCYSCEVCNLSCGRRINNALGHIRQLHYTAEDIIQYTAVRTSATEWLYRGKYKIIKVEGKKFKCASCGIVKCSLQRLVMHLRAKHIHFEGPDQVVSFPQTDMQSCSGSTQDPVSVVSDNITVPSERKLDPLAVDNANIDEPCDHRASGPNDSDAEHLSSKEEGDDAETSKRILVIELQEEAKSNGLNLQDSKKRKVKVGNSKTNKRPRKTANQPIVIPDGPNRFKYNGYDVRLNDGDKCYYSGVCNYKGQTSIHSILAHIRIVHYTAEDKIKFTAVKISNTEWLYGGKYKIIKAEDKRLKCASCGSEKAQLQKIVLHIRTQHVDLEGPDEGVSLPVTHTPSLNDSTPNLDNVMSDNLPIPLEPKLEPLLGECDYVGEAWDLWECEANSQLPVIPKIEPLPERNDDEPWDHEESGAHDSDEEYLPSEDELIGMETSEEILGLSGETEDEGNYDDSNSQHAAVDNSETTKAKDGNIQTNGRLKRKLKPYKSKTVIPQGPNRFKYKELTFQQNEEDQTYTCDTCGFKSGPSMTSIHDHLRNHLAGKEKIELQPVAIPDGPNKFKYNGYDVRLNDEDQCYYCGVCNYRGHTSIQSTLAHIRSLHYTAEDKIKFSTIKISTTEWLYGGNYKIIQVDEKNFMCASCGSIKSKFHNLVVHIRTQHVDLEGAAEVFPIDNDSTAIQGEFESVPYTFNPADNKYTCGLCESQVPTWNNLTSHIRKTHTAPPKRVPCEICGKELLNEKVYRDHMRRHQADPVNCPTCNKQFKSKWRLKKHMKTHELGDEIQA